MNKQPLIKIEKKDVQKKLNEIHRLLFFILYDNGSFWHDLSKENHIKEHHIKLILEAMKKELTVVSDLVGGVE